jgi:hypothetical protein
MINIDDSRRGSAWLARPTLHRAPIDRIAAYSVSYSSRCSNTSRTAR